MAFGRGSMTKEMFGNRQPGAEKMKDGGKLKMVEKDGKSVPAFAADGVGKMKSGGKVGRGDGCCMKGKTKGAMC